MISYPLHCRARNCFQGCGVVMIGQRKEGKVSCAEKPIIASRLIGFPCGLWLERVWYEYEIDPFLDGCGGGEDEMKNGFHVRGDFTSRSRQSLSNDNVDESSKLVERQNPNFVATRGGDSAHRSHSVPSHIHPRFQPFICRCTPSLTKQLTN
mmetsp:Transcript_8509/g.13452  ORF Transcript_8509/g.13452 Transcript_8509/m.13452 type:complete len:152 (+) Transcript_8509:261-716(+)